MKQTNKKRLARGLAAVSALVVAFAVMTGCAGQKGASEAIVTYKGGGAVTKAEFDKFISANLLFSPQYASFKEDAAFQRNMMEQLVTFKILSSRADDKAKAAAETEAKSQMDQIKSYLEKQAGGMDAALKTAGVTAADLENFVKTNVLAVTAEESQITDQNVQAAYGEKIAADPHAYDVATVSHILISTSDSATGAAKRTKEEALKMAKEVKDALDKGADFAALAKEKSEDPGSKDNGGKYENADINQWVPEFRKAAAEQEIGKVGEPVETSYGYHVVKVESRRSRPVDEVKDQLRTELGQKKFYDFVKNELPALIETNNLPKPQAATPAPTTPVPAAGATPSAGSETPKVEAGK